MSATARLLDTGVWIALAFASHPGHRVAKKLFDSADSLHPLAFCRATQLSFLRLLTTPSIQTLYGAKGITNELAWSKSQELLALPQIIWLTEPTALEAEWKRGGGLPTVSPKVWMDAYLAAFAIAGHFELVTLDRDFTQFTRNGLKLTLLKPDTTRIQ